MPPIIEERASMMEIFNFNFNFDNAILIKETLDIENTVAADNIDIVDMS